MTDPHFSAQFRVKKIIQFVKSGRRYLASPFFYFSLVSAVLVGTLFFSSSGLAKLGSDNTNVVFINAPLSKTYQADSADSFLSQQDNSLLSAPSLSVTQDNFIAAVTPPHAVSLQTLGDVSSGLSTTASQSKEVTNYTVQSGDTIQSVADKFGISANTVVWANNLSKNSALTPGGKLTILPVSGVLHVVKVGDTVAALAKTYKANSDNIIAFNNLKNEEDIYVGDMLVIPGGSLPSKPQVFTAITAPDNFFIFPLLHFIITQGLHYYNAIDIQSLSGFGSPVYAAAGGTVQRAVGNGGWNLGMGNYVTILHDNGLVTYYGHLNSVLVQPGQRVEVGQQIGTEGQTGDATGPHVHFQVMGGKNPLAGYPVCTEFNNGKLVKYGDGSCMR